MNRNVVVICLTAVAISLLGVVAAVIFVGGDLERMLMWAGSILGPLIPSIAAYVRVAKVNDRVDTVGDQVDAVGDNVGIVAKRTNGILDRLFTRVRALEQAGGLVSPAPEASPAVTQGTEERPPSSAPG